MNNYEAFMIYVWDFRNINDVKNGCEVYPDMNDVNIKCTRKRGLLFLERDSSPVWDMKLLEALKL